VGKSGMASNGTTAIDLGWNVEEHFRTLPPEFYSLIEPERVGKQPVLLHTNPAAALLLGLQPAAISHSDFAAVFAGHLRVPGFSPLAMVYSGHQFGSYVPQLGDGRALLIAQVRNAKGELWDVQLKGAGRTPYSRFGDGRAVLRSTIREYLCSEAMAALGIPTTRALCLVATGEGVRRETVEPGAVLTRLSPSHIRFGHFQYFHYQQRPDLVRRLADHVIAEHFPGLTYLEWYREVVRRTASLLASWQAVGFAHGVMNTDNMSILGLTIDYGPFGFLDHYEPGWICNHSDEGGRYAFDQQPRVAKWNLWALANALVSLVPLPALGEVLEEFDACFAHGYFQLMRAKLGFERAEPGDPQLLDDLLALLAQGSVDYSQAFRRLYLGGRPWLELFPEAQRAAAEAWWERYKARSAGESERSAMLAVNPKFVLRNWVAETAIRALEDRGDLAPLDRIFTLLQQPFDEHEAEEDLAAGPVGSMRGLCVSCSS
jgi:serine/tyrosine/threonine adenylyltransferase